MESRGDEVEAEVEAEKTLDGIAMRIRRKKDYWEDEVEVGLLLVGAGGETPQWRCI